ncbi:cytochrome b5 [Morchella conica CCBAS932]|uniref:Cytochrome b5 n=1 Tax=Morchella conica CCBAS932 TaxID=1392247 RepID=A0A3N4L202_9PEZI|nr:cytochrome b5 [Morchella conica CCBAS932]
MSETTFTLEQVKEHQSKKDLWMIIHDKVYSISGFVDEHPGGEEVLMDVAGVDATEAFEDVGHSDEAREILAGLLVGNLKRSPSNKKPVASASKPATAQSSSTDAGVAIYAFFAVAAVGALVAYKLYA